MKPDEWIVSPQEYVFWLMMMDPKMTRHEASKLMREHYKNIHGEYPEDHKPTCDLFGIRRAHI